MWGRPTYSAFLVVLQILTTFPGQAFAIMNNTTDCNMPLGLEDGRVRANQITASSFSPDFYIGNGNSAAMKAEYCRLNDRYAWCTQKSPRTEDVWLMIDLGNVTNVTGLATQGFVGVNDYYVKSYKLSYSINGSRWKFVMELGKEKVFLANKHGVDTKKNSFDPILARYVKILPISYSITICLRIEIYGCTTATQLQASTDSLSSYTTAPDIVLSTVPTTRHTTTLRFTQPVKSAVHANQRQEGSLSKEDFILIGCSIFGGLVAIVVFPILVFLTIKCVRKRRMLNHYKLTGVSRYSECLVNEVENV